MREKRISCGGVRLWQASGKSELEINGKDADEDGCGMLLLASDQSHRNTSAPGWLAGLLAEAAGDALCGGGSSGSGDGRDFSLLLHLLGRERSSTSTASLALGLAAYAKHKHKVPRCIPVRDRCKTINQSSTKHRTSVAASHLSVALFLRQISLPHFPATRLSPGSKPRSFERSNVAVSVKDPFLRQAFRDYLTARRIPRLADGCYIENNRRNYGCNLTSRRQIPITTPTR